MSNREILQNARSIIVRNILDGQRPGVDEMSLMSEPYRKVWEEHDTGIIEKAALLPDWADALD